MAGIVPTVRPSTAAQQSAGVGSPDTVTETPPDPVLVVVDSPARRMAVTFSVEVKVRTACTRRPVKVQVNCTFVTPHG